MFRGKFHIVTLAAMTFSAVPAASLATPVAIDIGSTSNGIVGIYSATFDAALSGCGASSPSYCPFFLGEPPGGFVGNPPTGRRIAINPNPTGVINGVPAGISPTPTAGSYLDLTLAADKSTLTVSGGTVAVPTIGLVIAGDAANPAPTVITAFGAGFVFNAVPHTVPINASRQAEFFVDLYPSTLAVDFTTLSVAINPPGSCSGPLCVLVSILTFDMFRYRLLIQYDATYSSFTGTFIGQTGNNSMVFANLNSAPVPIPAAHDDTASTTVNTAVPISIAQNDVGFVDPVTVAVFTPPLHGAVQFSGSPGPQTGVLATYTPNTGYAGSDSFQYAIYDGVTAGVATVNVTVNPNAVNDNTTTDIAQPVTIHVLANDLGFLDPVTVGIMAIPGHGTLTVNNSPGPQASVSVTYTPTGHLLEPDSFVYSATSSGGTDNATVVIDITGSDTDADLVADQFDNCTLVGNANQRDSDSDGYGNACDPDLNNDGVVNINDLNRMKARLGVFPVVDVAADLDGNGSVNINDLNRLKSFLGKPPGPSGLHPNCPPTCP